MLVSNILLQNKLLPLTEKNGWGAPRTRASSLEHLKMPDSQEALKGKKYNQETKIKLHNDDDI